MSAFPRVGELRRYRYLLSRLVARDLKARYKGSVLGFLWTILNPLLVMLVLTIVFSRIIRIHVEQYPIFMLCGLLPWSFFSTGLVNGTSSVLMSGPLLKKVYFPQELFPLSAILSNLVNHLLSIGVLFVFLLVSRVPLGPALPFLPVVLFFEFCFVYGVALMLAAANVFYRDVQQVLEVVLLAWFYGTPIFYPVSMVPEPYVHLFLANPMASFVVLMRWVLMGREPSAEILGFAWGVAVLGSLGALMVGQIVFDARKHRFAEII